MIPDESPPAADPPSPVPRGQGKGRNGTLAEYSLEELIARWEEFFADQGLESAIIGLADRYPEERSLEVGFDALNRFDTDMSIHLLRQPLNVLAAGEEAIRRVVPPAEEAVEIHLRVSGLPRDSRIAIRDLRAKHLGRFIAVEGLVRKATEVRPMVVDAMFQCLRCGTVIKEPQEGQAFREPMECYEDQGGCKRSASATKFKLLGEASRFSDTQKIEIQEAPEGLRGGEEPQRLSAFTEDDLTGRITPGMRVVLNGVLRSSQRGRPGQKSTLFDILLDVNSITLEQVEFEEIEVTDADIQRIEAEAADPDIFRKIVASIAPSLYGLTTEKEALALQLFSGVPKVMPDGRRIRGDLHVILVGDPGCLIGDERIVLGNGTIAKLGGLGREHLEPIRTQVRLGTGGYHNGWATRFHRYEDQPILEVVTETGKCIKGTYNHPLMAWNRSTRSSEWRRLDELRVGDRLQVADSIKCWKQALVPTGWGEPKYYHKSWHVKVPLYVNEDLASIMGYVLGDGWIQDRRVGYVLADGEADLDPRLTGLFERVFGTAPRRSGHRGQVTQFQVNRTPIARWLSELREKRVPDAILRSRNSVVSAFLRWLFEADGSCFTRGRGRTAVTLRSSEIELLRDVQILLLRWGIHSSILWEKPPRPHLSRGALVTGGPTGSLVIRRANSIIRYAKHVGFESRKKKDRLRAVVGYVGARTRRWHGQRLERIVSIRPAGPATVYDVEVPGPQRFIANGIISHNTAKSELLSYMSRLSPRGIYATGKAASAAGLCVSGESLVATGEGLRPIEHVVQPAFFEEIRLRPVEASSASGEITTFDSRGKNTLRGLDAVWRLKAPPNLLDIRTRSGFGVRVTPATKLLVDHAMGQSWIQAKFVRPGMRIATARSLGFGGAEPPLVIDLLQGISSRIAVDVDPSLIRDIADRLEGSYGTIREAASRLLISEDSLYHQWREGRHRIPLAIVLRLAATVGTSREIVAAAIRDYSQAGGHPIRLPPRVSPDLAYFAGLIAGDGSIEPTPAGGLSIRLATSNEELGAEYDGLVNRLFGVRTSVTPASPARAGSHRFHSKLVGTILNELGVPASPKSSRVTLPEVILNGKEDILAAYLRGLFDTDGTVQARKGGSSGVFLTTTSAVLAERMKFALLRFGIHARIRVRRVAGRRSVRLDGKAIVSRHDQHVVEIRDWPSISAFRSRIGFRHAGKAQTLARIEARRPHSNLDLVSGAGPHLREIRRLLGLGPTDAYGPHQGGGRAIERGEKSALHSTLEELISGLARAYETDAWTGERIAFPRSLRARVLDALRKVGTSAAVLAGETRITRDRSTEYFYRQRRAVVRVPVRILERLARILAVHAPDLAGETNALIRPVMSRIARIPARLQFLRTLASTDVRWEPVKSVGPTPPPSPTVFDLTVRDAHAFVANGILVHNTAAAVRDEFGEGRWTLEAGALVLADKGLACLHPDAEVLIDGVPTAAKDAFDVAKAFPASIRGRPIAISPLGANVGTFDVSHLRAGESVASSVTRRRYTGPILRLTLDSGFELRLTPDHLVLDGDSLEWKPLGEIAPRGRLVASQRVLGHARPVFILDIIPDDWIVALAPQEKLEIRGHLLRRFPRLSDAVRTYGLRRDALSGRGAIRAGVLRRMLKDLGLLDEWRRRPLACGRTAATERLRVATITPELSYLLGFILGDGHVSVSRRRSSVSIFQSAVHLPYIQQVLRATKAVSSRSWGMHERTTTAKIRGADLRSRGYHMHRGSNLLAFLHGWLVADDLANLLRLDNESLRGFVAGLLDSDGCVSIKSSRKDSSTYESVDVEFLFSNSRKSNLRFLYALRRFDVFSRLREGRGVLTVRVTSQMDARRLMECVAPYSAKWKRLPAPKHGVHSGHGEAPVRQVMDLLRGTSPRPAQLVAAGLWSTFHAFANGGRRPSKNALAKLGAALSPGMTATQTARLGALVGEDYALERIAEVRVEEYDGYVYDFRVPEGENFVCDGTVVHNCIDEIDKMNPNDRSAIHEALEQQRISVAKAGITAVLQARCAVLAAANPKFGRFDENKYIAEQIDLPPTLLSRFDVIFSLIDRPETERDRNMADHILRGHLVGEWLRRKEEGREVPEEQTEVEEPYTPHFEPIFFRKYVAYAKRVSPVMTTDAMGAIKAKYLEIRKTGEGAGASVPITPRQLEAIIRLSEASARARLSPAVGVEDTERAIRITEYWMNRVAGEEGGRFDIDIVQVGISQSQREQIISLRDVIGQLSEQGPGGAADYDDIVRAAAERNMTAASVDKWLKRWAEEGEIYSPAKNKYKLVERL